LLRPLQLEIPTTSMQILAKYFALTFLFVCGVFFSSAQSSHKNIRIDGQDMLSFYPPCEPSIAISPKNPAMIVAGSVLDNVYLSTDTGATWMKKKLYSDLGVYGDPVIVSNPKKQFFYYLHLSNPQNKAWGDDSFLDRIVIQHSKDGLNWSSGSGIGYHPTKDQDKHWAAHNGKKMICTWTQFDKYESTTPGDSTNILFSRSNAKGKKWTKATRINQIAGDCLDGDNTVEGAVPAFGTEGEIYVAWALGDKIYFDRSLDKGKTWLEKDMIAASISGGWEMAIPGIMRCNGMPVTVCDLSEGPNRGTIYICWADLRNGETNSDIFITSSNDKGKTWTTPVRVNDDKTPAHQFFPWLAIDQSNGRLHIVFYDRRNFSDTKTDVYLASSGDGGKSWNNERISESAFEPTDKVFFGDYNNISAHNGIIRPIWTRCVDGKLSVWTALINR